MKKNVIAWIVLVIIIIAVIVAAVVFSTNGNKNNGGNGTTGGEQQPSNTVTADSGKAQVNIVEGESFTIEPENLTSIQ